MENDQEEPLAGSNSQVEKDQVPQLTQQVATQPILHFTCQKLPASVAKKTSGLATLLNAQKIDLKKLKQCLAQGIPDEAPILREYSWKLVLDYLPPQKAQWKQKVSQQQATYQALLEMFLPSDKFADYPIWLKKSHPRFKELEEDYLIWEQIEKDTSRTHAEFTFFSTQSSPIMVPYLTSAKRQKFKMINGQNEEDYKQFMASKEKQRKTYRYDYMTRILYIYARLNPRVQYVQGMNEILAPIFYLVNVGKPSGALEEAACFFMFNRAVSEVIELHIKDLDRSENGIYGRLQQVNEMLVVIEPMIWNRLQQLKIDPFFYCFRWVTLLFAQDFALFDTLRIWQSIFSVDDRLRFINLTAIAIIMNCKEVILEGEFTVVLEHMQNIQDRIEVHRVVQTASELYLEFRDKQFSHHAKQTKKMLHGRRLQKQQQGKGEEDGLLKKITGFMSGFL